MTEFAHDLVAQDAVVKEFFSDDDVENTAFEGAAFFGMCPKNENWSGDEHSYVVKYNYGQGASNDFDVAQDMSTKSGAGFVRFKVPARTDHEIANISNDLIDSCTSSRGTFVEMLEDIPKSNLENFGNRIGIEMYGTGSGARAVVSTSTTIASATCYVATLDDILGIEVGMQLDSAPAETSGSVNAYGSQGHGLYVIGVDSNLGTFLVGDDPDPTVANQVFLNSATHGIPDIAHGDYLFPRGDRNRKFNGFKAWIPATVSGSDSFCNVNRSIYRSRLAGQYYNAVTEGGSLLTTLIQASSRVSRVGGKLSHFFMCEADHNRLELECISRGKLQEVEAKSTAQVGYKGIVIMGRRGPITCVADRCCPAGTIVGVNLEDWELFSAGKMIQTVKRDGLTWLRAPRGDGQEIRFRSRGALRCRNPRNQIRINVPAITA